MKSSNIPLGYFRIVEYSDLDKCSIQSRTGRHFDKSVFASPAIFLIRFSRSCLKAYRGRTFDVHPLSFG